MMLSTTDSELEAFVTSDWARGFQDIFHDAPVPAPKLLLPPRFQQQGAPPASTVCVPLRKTCPHIS